MAYRYASCDLTSVAPPKFNLPVTPTKIDEPYEADNDFDPFGEQPTSPASPEFLIAKAPTWVEADKPYYGSSKILIDVSDNMETIKTPATPTSKIISATRIEYWSGGEIHEEASDMSDSPASNDGAFELFGTVIPSGIRGGGGAHGGYKSVDSLHQATKEPARRVNSTSYNYLGGWGVAPGDWGGASPNPTPSVNAQAPDVRRVTYDGWGNKVAEKPKKTEANDKWPPLPAPTQQAVDYEYDDPYPIDDGGIVYQGRKDMPWDIHPDVRQELEDYRSSRSGSSRASPLSEADRKNMEYRGSPISKRDRKYSQSHAAYIRSHQSQSSQDSKKPVVKGRHKVKESFEVYELRMMKLNLEDERNRLVAENASLKAQHEKDAEKFKAIKEEIKRWQNHSIDLSKLSKHYADQAKKVTELIESQKVKEEPGVVGGATWMSPRAALNYGRGGYSSQDWW